MYKGKYNECNEIMNVFGEGREINVGDKSQYLRSAIIKAELEVNTPIWEDRVRISPKEEDIVINSDF